MLATAESHSTTASGYFELATILRHGDGNERRRRAVLGFLFRCDFRRASKCFLCFGIGLVTIEHAIGMRDGLDTPKSNCSFLSLGPLSLLLVFVCVLQGIIGNVSCCTRIQARAEIISMYSSTKPTLSSRTFMIRSVLITSLVITVASSRLPNDSSLSVRRSRSSFPPEIPSPDSSEAFALGRKSCFFSSSPRR